MWCLFASSSSILAACRQSQSLKTTAKEASENQTQSEEMVHQLNAIRWTRRRVESSCVPLLSIITTSCPSVAGLLQPAARTVVA